MGIIRKYLCADGLLEIVRHCVWRKKLKPVMGSSYSWVDCIMAGLAIFGLKCSSLLQFEKRKVADPMIRRNLRTLYHVEKAPSDTCLRERLDQISPTLFRTIFKTIFAYLQRGKALESFRYLGGYYIVSIDGTGQYSSTKVHCKNCCEKHHRDGKVTYYHQMLGAAIVHPEKNVVIPLAPEPIIKGDGESKNDCERNASKRLLTDLRREHPHLKVLVVEDGLGSNYPNLSLLDSLKMDYVIGVKPGDHTYLFDWIRNIKAEVHVQTDEHGTQHHFEYYKDVPLNDRNFEYRVNVLKYTETKNTGKIQHFSWVTKMPINEKNAYDLMRAGRARWRIENETFNTLKNQGYNFSHNYGHGEKNLCSVMTMLMMLAFLIDQVQQLCCKVYQKARAHMGPLRMLFERIRVLLEYAVWRSMNEILVFIGDPENRAPPEGAAWVKD